MGGVTRDVAVETKQKSVVEVQETETGASDTRLLIGLLQFKRATT